MDPKRQLLTIYTLCFTAVLIISTTSATSADVSIGTCEDDLHVAGQLNAYSIFESASGCTNEDSNSTPDACEVPSRPRKRNIHELVSLANPCDFSCFNIALQFHSYPPSTLEEAQDNARAAEEHFGSECEQEDSISPEGDICRSNGPLLSQPGSLAALALASGGGGGVGAASAWACFNYDLVNHDTVFKLNQDDDRVCETTEESRLAKLCYRPD